MKTDTTEYLIHKIRFRIWLFIICLCLSGITAFPLMSEITFLHNTISPYCPQPIQLWINKVSQGISCVNSSYPFMAYGTDWLAFSHLVIAVVFLGPLRDPVRNIWIIEFGKIACLMVFPLAFICGTIRGIPFWWQLIDCSFGVAGYILLAFIHTNIRQLESIKSTYNNL